MLELHYEYADCVRNSERVSWLVDEVIPPGTRLDFSKAFLPDALCGAPRVAFLDDSERLTLNQINGNAYLNLFAFVEEYIIAQVANHVQAEMFGDHNALRALTRFADEELKHQQVFWRFREAFDRDFSTHCSVLSAPAEVAAIILGKSPIAVMFVTYHLELMTQQHYTECVRGRNELDPLFVKLLHHHWLEESQHARIDALELAKLVAAATPDLIDRAFADYLDLVGAFDGLLAQQAGFDLESLVAATGRRFSEREAKQVVDVQHAAYRRTFLTFGMRNRAFVDMVKSLSADGAQRIAHRAEVLDGS